MLQIDLQNTNVDEMDQTIHFMIHTAVHQRNRGRLVFNDIQTNKETCSHGHPILRLRKPNK